MDSKTRLNQFKKVYNAFYLKPMTMKEASIQTDIDRSNICWYCRNLRHSDRLFKVGKKYCSITKHKAAILTTNPELAPADNQLKLFE